MVLLRGERLSSNNTIEVKLNIQSPDSNRLLDYGITNDRYVSLNSDSKNKNSLDNPNSETAKTLRCFGNLDYWQQINNFSLTPRNSEQRNDWNEIFFNNIRKEISNHIKPKEKCDRWDNFISKIIPDIKIKTFKNSILLFEFELMLNAFHRINKKPFKKLSFLKIDQREWSNFDAILILPDVKRFIFFECKLDSDISLGTKNFPLVNQIFRNLESAYLLTNHEESLYNEWDFNYIFVCPKKQYDYNSTLYSYLIKDIQKNGIELYTKLLDAEYKVKLDNNTGKYLEDFIKEGGNKISVTHWEELPQQNN